MLKTCELQKAENTDYLYPSSHAAASKESKTSLSFQGTSCEPAFVLVLFCYLEERDAVDVTEALADRNTCEVLPTKNSKVTDSEDEIKLIETVPAGSEINHNNGRSKRRAATTAAKKQRQVLEDSDEDGEFEETAQGDSDDEFKAGKWSHKHKVGQHWGKPLPVLPHQVSTFK